MKKVKRKRKVRKVKKPVVIVKDDFLYPMPWRPQPSEMNRDIIYSEIGELK